MSSLDGRVVDVDDGIRHDGMAAFLAREAKPSTPLQRASKRVVAM